MQDEGVKLPAWAEEDVEFYSPAPGTKEWNATGPVDQYNTDRLKMQKVEKPAHLYRLPSKEEKDDPNCQLR